MWTTEQNRNYYNKNIEKEKARKKIWYLENKEKILKRLKEKRNLLKINKK